MMYSSLVDFGAANNDPSIETKDTVQGRLR